MPISRHRAAPAAVLAVALTITGCSRGSTSSADAATTAATGASGCPDAFTAAKAAVQQAEDPNAAWTGPTTGPKATAGKTIVYVAQTMTNPGVAGVATGVQEAGKTIGWTVRVVDGQGTPAGIQAAFSQAIALKPAGIVIGGFDPNSTAQQLKQANDAGIPLIGWHAVGTPGPSATPKLFSNVTTKVEDVAKISADWIIAQSNGTAGAVIFTDSSIPFAENKSQMIKKQLETCATVKVLSYENIPIPDTSTRTPQQVSSLLSRFGDKWTHSVAINDLYFADAAAALRAGGKDGAGAPLNIGAGDGDPSAFQRIRDKQYQAATVPEPLAEQGWQIVDEFNRAFAGEPASGYVAPAHLTTAANVGTSASWDPAGYRDAYKSIWGK
ncbi:sugar ABC transporter substrate-binding protein [Actinoplanes sp. ATCC 53533]|uniref:substrate-binding domain-containing protein n=1 Tax=Actinoplanes sp. ATCC 53533 TaxID=1288362 RepID=UPI000F7855DD|nr:substrate-binding domain-containing protein [Actinoplanes sp. ATCC 53533]RSM54909.1 sugar ABC transporter substrate-binding protein [Actinoplanes sp. ATCC 53533]